MHSKPIRAWHTFRVKAHTDGRRRRRRFNVGRVLVLNKPPALMTGIESKPSVSPNPTCRADVAALTPLPRLS